MKKSLSVLAGLILSSALLTACGAGTSASTPKSIDLWMPPLAADNLDKELWDAIVAPFEKEKGVDVNVTVVPWDSYETKYLTGISSGAGPDVGYMYSEMIGDYIKKDQLISLDGKVTDEQKDNLYFLDKGVINGKQYTLPFVVGGARVLMYNKTLLAEAGVEPPTTWDEFATAAKAVKAKGIQPMTAPWGDPSRGIMNGQFFPFVWQAGGDLFTEDGTKTQFNTPEVIEAAKYLLSLKTDGILPDATTGITVDTARKAFESGEVAFTITTEQEATIYEAAGVDLGWVTSLQGKDRGTFIAGDALVMLKGCESQELCYDLMSFLQAGPQMEAFHKQANFPPIGKDEKSIYSPELQKIYTEEADILHVLPVVANGVPAYNALYKNLQQMLNGEKTPEQAMADAATEGDAALAQA